MLLFVYAFVACYVAQIFPSGNGARRPWFFPLIPSYWIDNSNNSTSSERATVADAENGTEGPDLDNCVSVNGVRMKLGNVDALDDVSLTLARGEVTALLGM
jgi:ABC-type transport system involved in cytochrome bd biosynthesis fused ATPase/permease subunit